jgi:hypothetical protein
MCCKEISYSLSYQYIELDSKLLYVLRIECSSFITRFCLGVGFFYVEFEQYVTTNAFIPCPLIYLL